MIHSRHILDAVLVWAVLLAAPMAFANAQPSGPNIIESIEMASAENRTRLIIHSRRPLAYTAGKEGDEEDLAGTIVLFFPNTRVSTQIPTIPASHPHLSFLTANSEAVKNAFTRLHIGMKEAVTYQIRREAGAILIEFHIDSETAKKSEGNEKPNGDGNPEIPLKSVDIVSGENGLRIQVNAESSLTDYRSFTIPNPSRIIYDISGLKTDNDRETLVPVNSRWAQAVRYFATHNGLRLVIETENRLLDAFSAWPNDDGLLIEADRSGPVRPSAKPARILRVGFTAEDDGAAAYAVEADRPMVYDVQRIGSKRLSLTLTNTELPEPLSRASFQSTGVSISAPEIQEGAGSIVISARFDQPTAFMVEQSGSTLVWRIEGTLESGTAEAGEKEMIPAEKGINVPDDIQQETSKFLEKWKSAWEATAGKDGHMDAYMALYSENFSAGGLNKSEWRSDKQRKNSRRTWIQGKVMDLAFIAATKPGRWTIRFYLDYQAENYSEILEKTMTLVRESGHFLILQEKSRLATNRYKGKENVPEE